MTMTPRAHGRCLCGAIRYTVRGELADVSNCHCERCRQFTGHHMAATSAELDDIDEGFEHQHRMRQTYSPAYGSTIGTLEGEVPREILTPAFDVPIGDSTGYGDACNAGFIKGLSLGWDLENCAWLGRACGGLAIQGLGSDAGIESFESMVEFAKKTPKRPITD